MPLSPPQISQRLAWYRTRTSARWEASGVFLDSSNSLSRWKQLESSLKIRLEPHSKRSNSITPKNHLMLCGETSQGAHRHKNCSWLSEFRSYVDSCNLQAVLRQVISLFQSEFSTECDLVLPLLISNALFFRYRHPVASYVSFLVFSSLLSFPLRFLQYRVSVSQKAVPTQDVDNPVSSQNYAGT